MVSNVTPSIFGHLQRGTSIPSIVTAGRSPTCLLCGVKRVTCDLVGAMESFFLAAHSIMGVTPSWSFRPRVARSGSDSNAVKSSAYDVRMSARVGQSDTKKLNRLGDKTDPCGTPDLRIIGFDFADL
jgi:hypothetical protein